MPPKQKLRPCHGVGAYREGLYVVSDAPGFGKVHFGDVPTCAKCFKPMGEPEIDRKPKGWSSASWTTMILQHPVAPFNFKLYPTGNLLPETFKGSIPLKLEAPVTSAQALEIAEAAREAHE